MQDVEIAHLLGSLARDEVFVVEESRRMDEELADGDALRVRRERRKEARDRVVVRQLSARGEDLDRRCGELLAHRRETEVRLRRDRRTRLEVRQSVARA